MLLIGRLLSPFVRRTKVSMNLLGIDCNLEPYGTTTHVNEIAAHNPLVRVPALILDDGETLVDSAAILDYLDQLVGPEKALVPPTGAERRKVLKLVAFGTGAAEKGVTVYYELTRRPDDKIWQEAVEKNSAQILGGLKALEEAASDGGSWLVEPGVTQADITAAVAYEFIQEVLPDLIDTSALPRLTALVARMNELDGFSSTHPSRE